MKLSATKENLQKGLALTSRAVGNAATLPILANVLIETDNGRLRLSATDLEIGVITYVGAKVESDGAITIPARTLSDFVSTNSDETITLSVEKENITALSASYKAEIPGIAAAEYPSIPTVETGVKVVLPAKELLLALRSVIMAAAADEARPALAGVLVKGNDTKQLAIVATDSFRLAEYIINLEQEVSGVSFIVPIRAVHEIIRIIGASPDITAVIITASQNQLYCKIGETELVTRLIEANYPDYQKVMPGGFVTEVVVATEELVNALRMAAIFTTNSANNVHVKVDDQAVRLSSVASQYGQEVSALNAEVMHHTEDKKIDIAFNTRYLLDAAVAAGGSKTVLKISGPLSAAVVVNPDLPTYQHIVMPIRVS